MTADIATTHEFNNYTVCGLVVLAQPDHYQSVLGQLAELEYVEVHRSDPNGRMAITIEEFPDSPLITHQIDQVRHLKGVLDVSLAYTHTEPILDTKADITECHHE